jgi:hypothetical protein
MIVVFNRTLPLDASGGSRRALPGHPISPVESYRHLIYWITIIEYNLKARAGPRDS